MRTSPRWLASCRRPACSMWRTAHPTIRALLVRARERGTPADWLLRSPHNRALPDGGRLWAKVLASPPLGEIRFTLPEGRRGAFE